MSVLPAVLVVEDEKSVRDSVARVLGAEGFRLDFAPDLETALRHPWLTTCDGILCDLKLPDGSGLEVLKALQRDRPNVPVVATTGFATTETLAEARAAGAKDILLKPFDSAELLYVMRHAIAARTPSPEDPP